MNAMLVALLMYVVLQFAIGAWFSRTMATDTDYILAGRRLGIGLVTFSVFATYFGAEAIVASAGSVHEKGLQGAIVDPLCYAIALILVALFFAARLWRADLVTFADFFRARYSPGVERLVVLVLLPGSVLWAAAQVRAFGQILSANSALSLPAAIAIAGGLVAIYSVVGGLLADAITDLIQGIVVMVGLVILAIAVIASFGSLGAAAAAIPAERLHLSFDAGLLKTLETIAIPVCGTIVAVELVSRFLGAKSAADAVAGTLIGGLLYLAVGSIPVFLGLVGPILLPGLEDAEQIVPKLAESYLPPVLHVVFTGAVVSAILSAVHAALHAPAAQVSHNVVIRYRPQMSDRDRLWSVRLTVAVLAGIAYLLALTSETIKELVETASAVGSAGVFVVTMFGLFTKFGGASSAYAAIASGVLVWASAKFALHLDTPYLSGLGAALVAYFATAIYFHRTARIAAAT